MDWLSITKATLGLVTSMGVGTIVSNAIKATTPTNVNAINRVTIQVGSFILSAFVAHQTVKYMDEEIDSMLRIDRKPN
jgi:uncharacterized membrane protein YeiH